jgi:hypothetical protein
MNELMIRTVIRNKNQIMLHVKSSVPMQSTTISKKRGRLIVEMEKLSSVYIEDKHQQ